MIVRLLIFVFIISSINSCAPHDPDADYSTSEALAFNLIKTCVDKSLSIHSEFNTPTYLLDINPSENFKKEAVDSFFKIKNGGLTAAYDDSLIAIANKNLSRSRVLESFILKFIEVEYIDKKNVYVKLSKIRSANQVIKIGLDLERVGDNYKVIKCEIRR